MEKLNAGDLVKEIGTPFLQRNEYEIVTIYESGKCLIKTTIADKDQTIWSLEVDISSLLQI